MTPICAFDIAPDGRARALDTLEGAITRGYRWVHLDLNDPASADWVRATLPAAAAGLLAAETRPRVDPHEEGLLLTLRGVNLNVGDAPEDMVSLRLWISPTLIVSMRRRRIFAIDDLRQAAVANTAPPSVGAFVAALVTGLVTRIENTSLALDDLADAMEDSVYENEEPALPELAPLRRQVIKLRRHMGPQAAALHDLAHLETAIFPRGLRTALRDSANRATRTDEELHEIRERLTALADHIDMAQTTRMGRNSYVLSVIAGIFLPLGVITGLFGVNLAGMPGSDQPWAFAALCIAMGVICLAGWAALRWKRWL